MPGSNVNLSWSVITRAAEGDGAARSLFGRSYLPVVRRFLQVRWQGTPLAGDVDDATQEVFLECLREGGVLHRADPGKGNLRGLLFGVTRNVGARFEERRGGRRETNETDRELLDLIQSREPSASVAFDREWARTLLRLAADRMRERAADRSEAAQMRVELLHVRFQEGLPIKDIARRWGIDAARLHKAYGTARTEFRAVLREVVGEHTARSEADLDREVERVLQLIR